MRVKPLRLAFVLIVGVLVLAFFASNWQNTFAQTVPTVPTVPTAKSTQPTDHDKDTPTPPAPTQESIEKICFPVGPAMPNKGTLKDLAGADFPGQSACVDGNICLFKIPVSMAPERSQLYFHEEVMQVKFYVKGVSVKEPPCGSYNVFFILNSWTRPYYKQNPEKVQLYWYDPVKTLWTQLPSALEEKNGEFGSLNSRPAQWGFYALGFSAGK